VQANRDSSLHYLKKHIALKNEVESSKQSKQMLKQESKYEAEKFIAHEQAEAEKQQLIEAAENKWKNIVMTLVIAVALILVYVAIVSVRRLKSTKVKNELIREINDELRYQKKEITDSISYARRIQNAILPSSDMIAEFLPNSFVYYNPKDIVAGDFYWISTPTESAADKVLFAVADCTGHGVPGAIMSVICGNALSSAVKEFDLNSPEQILNKANAIIQEALRTTADDVRDGMDIALCLWNKATNKLHYSGAFNSFYCCRNGELIILKADRIPVGKYVQTDKTFTLHEMSLQQGDTFYLFTDGYADQFGGVKGKKFKTNALKAMLLSICEQPLAAQKAFLVQRFEEWRGDLEQVDDVCVLGVRV
jgi:serine phosphatase RsbU (regulator of sigma subunit)